MLLNVTGALNAMAEQSGLEMRTVTDNTFAHRPMDLAEGERAVVHAAFLALGDDPAG